MQSKEVKDDVVNVKVSDEKGVLLFEGKVSTDVTPDELTRIGCFRVRFLNNLHNKATKEKVTSFKGMRNVELIASYGSDSSMTFSSVLYRCDDGVLRSSKRVPSCECVMMSVWYLSDEKSENVFKCEALEELELSACRLRQIPNDIGKMKKLKRLRLCGLKEFNSIPEEMGELSFLKELWIEKIGIKALPKSIGGLSQLEKLDLINLRQLNSFPECICRLSNLKELSIIGCGIEGLLKSIVGLRKLEKLLCYRLPNLKSLPEEIGMLECLNELSIESCGIEMLPESIGRLKQLEKLDLEYLEELKSIPESVGQLSNLKVLLINDCGVESLPKSIGGLGQLEELSLQSLYDLQSIPEEIGCLSNLKTLEIKFFEIERIPKSVRDLKLLTSLNLRGLSSLQLDPEDVLAFSRLKKLSVQRCHHVFQGNLSNAFGQMLRMSVSLREVCFDGDEVQEEMWRVAFLENGSITKSDSELFFQCDDICARNRANHARAISSVVCMMAIRRCRSALNGVPREMIEMLGKMLWITRCDVEAWKTT